MSDNNQTKKTKRGDNAFLLQGSILAAASIISRVIGLIYRIPLTNIIGKQGNDYYGVAFEIYNIMLIISSYSIPLALSKLVATRMAKGQAKNAYRVFWGALVFAIITGGAAGLFAFFGADFLCGTLLQTPMAYIALKVLAPTLFIVAIVGVLRGFFQGLNTMVPSALSQILEQIMNAIVSVVAAYNLYNYGSKVAKIHNNPDYAPAFGAAGGTLGTLSGAGYCAGRNAFYILCISACMEKEIKRDHDRRREGYGTITKILIMTIIPVLLSTTLYNLVSLIDVGLFKNIADIQGYDKTLISEWWGAYTGEYRVIQNIPLSIASSIAASAVPSLSTAFHAGDKAGVQNQIHSATRFVMIVSIPCAVGMAVLGKPIMMLLFSDSDQVSANLMLYGSVTVIVFGLSTLSNGLLQGIDRMKAPVYNAAIALVLQAGVLALTMYLFHWGIYAVVAANAFYGLTMCILNGIAVIRHTGTHQNIMTTYILPACASGVMGLAVWLVYQGIYMLVHHNSIATIISILAGIVVYGVILILFGGINEAEIRRIPKGNLIIKLCKKLHLL